MCGETCNNTVDVTDFSFPVHNNGRGGQFYKYTNKNAFGYGYKFYKINLSTKLNFHILLVSASSENTVSSSTFA